MCQIRTVKDDPLHYWNIRVEKQSEEIITLISYPQVACKIDLGQNKLPDAVVYPLHEGVLLSGLNKSGADIKSRYPGKLSCQMMYNYDEKGGLFYAALDGIGYPKNFRVHNNGFSVVMSQEMVLPVHLENKLSQPYEVVTGTFGGRWEDGATVYRKWSDRQQWAKKKIKDRSTPTWLKKANLFLNISVQAHIQNRGVDQIDQMIEQYHTFFDVPITVTVFGWEKNGMWIGPDFFPPQPNRTFYDKLCDRLDKRGDHLNFFTSGFRWGVKRKINKEKGSKEKIYTAYDDTENFIKYGRHLAVTKFDDELLIGKTPCADNYFMCTAYNDSRAKLEQCYREIYAMGVAGIDLDQNLGGEVYDCFNPQHPHPKGAGLWQTKAMDDFARAITELIKENSSKFYQGVEEPCERFAQLFDIYHGRAFTDIHWPVYGPGAVSLPLYNFLYHEYQIGYAGFIDEHKSPSGEIKYGIARAFIIGMIPGVRAYGKTKLKLPFSEELLMLRSYTELIKKNPEFALYGRMIGEATILHAIPFGHKIYNKKTSPIQWTSVQGFVWQASQNNKKALLCNFSISVGDY